MARESTAQRKTTGRVMHEFAHGELKSGRTAQQETEGRRHVGTAGRKSARKTARRRQA